MDKFSLATAREVIKKLGHYLARYGIPETFMTDGRPKFGSLNLKKN